MRRIILSLLICLGVSSCSREVRLHNDRFGEIRVERPYHAEHTVLLFSDESAESKQIAKILVDAGIAVATIPTPSYLTSVRKDGGNCSYLAGEIERMSQTIQSEVGISDYSSPLLVGLGAGASLAYGILLESPGTFRGAATLGFCPELPLSRPLCPGEALSSDSLNEGKSISLAPSSVVSAFWTAFQFASSFNCENSSVDPLVKRTPNSQLIPYDGSIAAALENAEWKTRFIETVEQTWQEETVAKDELVPDLPLVISIPKQVTSDFFVVFISGDGGWAWIDKSVTSEFNDRGIPVLGLNSLKYFWREKSPEELVDDLSKAILAFQLKTHLKKFSLMGFSMGAEVLPLSFNRFEETLKSDVRSIGMASPGKASDLEIHIGDWLGIDDDEGDDPILPELQKITSVPVVCITGDDEDEASVCKDSKQSNVTVLTMKGGHHFDGDYKRLAAALLGSQQNPAPTS